MFCPRYRLGTVLALAATLGLSPPPVNAGDKTIAATLDPDVVFHLSFDDETLYPDLSLGEVEPVKISGSQQFLPGHHGQALLLGGENGIKIDYQAARNLDVTVPGALSFWIAPHQWLNPADVKERPYLRFFHLQGAGAGYVFIQRQGFVNLTRPDGTLSRRTDMLQAGYYTLPGLKNLLVGAYNTLNWANGEWYLIVINWNRDRLILSINGKTASQANFSRPITSDDFPDTSKKPLTFTLGTGTSKETTLLDELIVYRRNLSEEEIHQLYQTNRNP